MNKFEATLHYGLTRSEPPTAGTLRDQFFASVLAAEIDSKETENLSRRLHQAYCEALHVEANENDEELPDYLVDFQQAERIYREAFRKAYCPNEAELPDGVGWWEHLSCDKRNYWHKGLIRDLGHLMGYYTKAHDEAAARYFEKHKDQIAAEYGVEV